MLDDVEEISAQLNKANQPAIKHMREMVDGFDERLADMEARANRPGSTTGRGTVAEREQQDHTKAFLNFVRKPDNGSYKQELENLQTHMERKAGNVVIATPSSGGYAVPEEIRRDVERLELKFSPVRSLVNVIQVGTGDVKEVVNVRGATAGWTSEFRRPHRTLTQTFARRPHWRRALCLPEGD